MQTVLIVIAVELFLAFVLLIYGLFKSRLTFNLIFPKINVPPIGIPEIKIPEIKFPSINIPPVNIPELRVPPISLNVQWPASNVQPARVQLMRRSENGEWVPYANLKADDPLVQTAIKTSGIAVKHADGSIEEGIQ